MKYIVVCIAIFVLLTTVGAATGSIIILNERDGNVVVSIQNQDETEDMHGNATLTLITQGYVETFEFSLKPLEKKEWVFVPKKTGTALLDVRYYLGESDKEQTITIAYPITRLLKREILGSIGFLVLVAIIAIAIWRKKK